MGHKRISRSEKEHLITQVWKLLDQGYHRSDIVKALCSGYGISQRQAYRYVEETRVLRLQSHLKRPAEEYYEDILQKASYIHHQSAKQQDFEMALKSLKTQAEIYALQQKYQGKGKNDTPTTHEAPLSPGLQNLLKTFDSLGGAQGAEQG